MSINVQGLRPGPYSEILFELENPIIPSNVLFPMIVGPADENLTIPAQEIIRYGLSYVIKYDLSSQVDGITKSFSIPSPFYPIVNSSGLVTNNVSDIVVYADDKKKQIKTLTGLTGEFEIFEILPVDTTLEVSFYFDDLDTLVEFDFLEQIDGVASSFYVDTLYIVDGTNRGIITNDPRNVTITINGVEVEAVSLDGLSGKFTLSSPPSISSTSAKITYYRAYPRQFDYLPHYNTVQQVNFVGTRPDAKDYIYGTHYVVKESNNFHLIVWGSSVLLNDLIIGSSSVGVSSKISITVYDEKLYGQELSDVDLSSGVGKTAYVIKDGTHKDITTHDSTTVTCYELDSGDIWPTQRTEIDVLYLIGEDQLVKFNNSITSGKIYLTYNINRIGASKFKVKVVTTGVSGTYKIIDSNNNVVPKILEGIHTVADPNFLATGIKWPGGISDLRVTPGASLSGEYEVVFSDAFNYEVFFESSSVGTGMVDQTFIDSTYGVRFTIMNPTGSYNFANGDSLKFVVSTSNRDVSPNPVFDIPGTQLIISTLVDTAVDDETEIDTYDIENPIPAGTYYYVNYEVTKDTLEKPIFLSRDDYLKGNVPVFVGEKTVENLGVLGVEAVFEAGAPYVCFLQSLKNSSGASGVTEFESVRKVWELGFENKQNPYFIVPMTSVETILNSWKNTVVMLSSYRYGRECILVRSVDPALSYQEAISIVNGFRNVRVQMWFPGDPIIDFVDDQGYSEEFLVHSSIGAATIAGLRCSGTYKVSESLVGETKVIPYIKKVNTTIAETSYGRLDVEGISILINEDGVIKVWNESTTDIEQVKTKEPTVIMSVDDVAMSSRKAVRFQIGEWADSDADVEKIIISTLNSKVQDRIIGNWEELTVTKDSIDNRITRVSVKIFSITIRKWITLTFRI